MGSHVVYGIVGMSGFQIRGANQGTLVWTVVALARRIFPLESLAIPSGGITGLEDHCDSFASRLRRAGLLPLREPTWLPALVQAALYQDYYTES